jgi:hypothetical protein
MNYAWWSSLSRKNQDDFVDIATDGYTRWETTKFKTSTVAPSYVGRLYTHERFPNFQNNDTIMKINDDDVMDGSIISTSDNLNMSWVGYISVLYDGQLLLYVVDEKISYIEGTIDDVKFRFQGSKLVIGSWPKFICLYEKIQQ